MPWAFRLTSLVPSLGPGRMTTALYTASQESLIWLTMRARTLCGRRVTERYGPLDLAHTTDEPECCIQCGRAAGRRS